MSSFPFPNFVELKQKAHRSFSEEQREDIRYWAGNFARSALLSPEAKVPLNDKGRKRLHARVATACRALVGEAGGDFPSFLTTANTSNVEPLSRQELAEFVSLANTTIRTFRKTFTLPRLERLRSALERLESAEILVAPHVFYEVQSLLEKRDSLDDVERLRLAASVSKLWLDVERRMRLPSEATRRDYIEFALTADELYRVYVAAGGNKRYGRWYKGGGRSGEEVIVDRYTGEAIDFIEAVFSQIVASRGEEKDREAVQNNIPTTPRRAIADAIRLKPASFRRFGDEARDEA